MGGARREEYLPLVFALDCFHASKTVSTDCLPCAKLNGTVADTEVQNRDKRYLL